MATARPEGERRIDTINKIFKPIAIFALIVFFLFISNLFIEYIKLSLCANDVTSHARKTGYLDYNVLTASVAERNLKISELEVISAKPAFGDRVSKLGDNLALKLRYYVYLQVADGVNIRIPIAASSSSNNDGYYGQGY